MSYRLQRHLFRILAGVALTTCVALTASAFEPHRSARSDETSAATASEASAGAREAMEVREVREAREVAPAPVATPAPAVEPTPVPVDVAAAAPAAAPIAPAPPPAPPAPPPLTSLPLTLVATSVSHGDAKWSSAVVADATSRQAAYWPGDYLPGAGPVVAIAPRYVDFLNARAKRVERLDLGAKLGIADRPVAAAPAPVPVRAGAVASGLDGELERSIKQVDATHVQVDRAFVDKVLADPMSMMGSLRARPVPAGQGGAGGLRLSGVKPGSLPARLGLQAGDTITAINGNELAGASPDKMLELYGKLKSTSALSVQVSRRGQPVTLEIAIR